MNTGKNYNKIVHGSGIQKIRSQFLVLKEWLSHPEMKKSHLAAGRSRITQYLDFLYSVIVHGTTLEDYLLYELYNKSHKERKTYVTGKKLHKFFDEVNNKDKTDVFINKNKFSEHFVEYLGRETFALDLEGKNVEDAKKWLGSKDVIFAKPSTGVEGKGVTRLSVSDAEETVNYCLENKLGTLEEAIVQHPDMNILYPDAINTVRLITLVENKEVKLLGASLRIGNGGHVDNAASGGIFASIDINNGKLDSVAFNKAGKKFDKHPITNQVIKGFQIPLWPQVIEICKKAALEVPDVRCVGWDVALTPEVPILIEGNDRWSRVVWQLPKQKGLYHLIQ